MLDRKQILAVVPARSGSKGLRHKNLRKLGGMSLLERAARTLQQVSCLDARIASTDSHAYAEEARRGGLDVPFLRPEHLSSDTAGAVETMQHALLASEAHYATRFDILLLAEPTSPLRCADDLEGACQLLVDSGADSVVSVSPLDSKSHPMKILTLRNDRLGFFRPQAARIQARQQLSGDYYYRNGVCYVITRECLLDRAAIFTDNTLPYVIDRPLANIDSLIDLQWAEFLLERASKEGSSECEEESAERECVTVDR